MGACFKHWQGITWLITEIDYVTLHMQLPGHDDQLPENEAER
jgi:hypothetical protein